MVQLYTNTFIIALVFALNAFHTTTNAQSESHRRPQKKIRGLSSSMDQNELGAGARRRTVTSRAAKKEDNDDGGNQDDWVGPQPDYAWATPSPAPIFPSVPPPVVSEGGQLPPPVVTTTTTSAPTTFTVTAPTGTAGTTEDGDTSYEEDGNTAVVTDREQICRAYARGKSLTTDYMIDVVYEFDVVLSNNVITQTSPVYIGMAINDAVTEHLTQVYIQEYCNEISDTSVSSMQSVGGGDDGALTDVVWGVTGGTAEKLSEECKDTTETSSVTTCHRLQTSNKIYFGNRTSESPAAVADMILETISEAFTSGAIIASMQMNGDDTDTSAAVVRTNYIQGSYGGSDGGDGSVSGAGSSERSTNSGRDGLRPAGKAFLTLFLLALIGVACYVAYKYGYPKFREHQWKRKHNTSSAAVDGASTTGKNSNMMSSSWLTASSWPASLDQIRQRVQQRRDSSANRGGVGDNTPVHSSDESTIPPPPPDDSDTDDIDDDDDEANNNAGKSRTVTEPKIVVAEHTASSSNNYIDDFGTEMFLHEPPEEKSSSRASTIFFDRSTTTNSSISRFSPSKLSKIEEQQQRKSRTSKRDEEASLDNTSLGDYNFSHDAFSFSDVNIIVDDASSYASSSPHYIQASKRSYTVPDTVHL